MSQSSQNTISSASLQSENLQSRGDHHLLLLVIWRWNSLKCLQPLEGILASLCLVWNHSSHCSPEDLGWSSEVESTTAGLDITSFSEEVKILQLVTVEVT